MCSRWSVPAFPEGFGALAAFFVAQDDPYLHEPSVGVVVGVDGVEAVAPFAGDQAEHAGSAYLDVAGSVFGGAQVGHDLPVVGVRPEVHLDEPLRIGVLPVLQCNGASYGLAIKQRAVVVLRYWCDLTEPEIADTLGISCGTVKSHTARAMKALRAHLVDAGIHSQKEIRSERGG